MEGYKYLVYYKTYSIFKNGYVWKCYKTNLNPLFVMGEIWYRSLTAIVNMNFSECTPAKISYWHEQGVNIELYISKYNGKEM